jgi:PAS domain S-box-containing protein
VEENLTPKGERLFVQVVKTALHDSLGRPLGTQGIWWDITEKTLAEEELQKSRERYELVVLGSQDGLWDLDLGSGEIYFSPRYKSMLGYEDHEMPSHLDEWVERIHPEDRERALGALRSYCDGQAPIYEAEFRLRHKDGSYRWVLSRGAALRDAEGRPYRVAGSHEDITARKRAEERLRESEERYRAVIGAIRDGIVLLDASGTILTCNESAERILGRSADQMTGLLSSDPSWRTIREDGSPFPSELYPATITLRTGRPCSDVIMGVHRPDGVLTWISINSQTLHRPGQAKLNEVMIIFSDITEYMQLQESHKQAVTELTMAHRRLGAIDPDSGLAESD